MVGIKLHISVPSKNKIIINNKNNSLNDEVGNNKMTWRLGFNVIIK